MRASMDIHGDWRRLPDHVHPQPGRDREDLSGAFWLEDEDPQEIIARDEATMAELGIDPVELARKMAWVVELSRLEGFYCRTFGNDRFTISSVYYRMMVPCPLCNGGGGNGELLIVDKVTGQELYFPSMMPHLILAHHFFESPHSSYRVEPEEANAVLEHFVVPDDFVYPPQT
jgi:hypothetical protein